MKAIQLVGVSVKVAPSYTNRVFSHPATRQAVAASTFRWKGRTRSQQQRRKNWVAPDLTKFPERSATISRYSKADHVLGDLTADALRKSAQLLTNDPSPERSDRPLNRFFRTRRDASRRVVEDIGVGSRGEISSALYAEGGKQVQDPSHELQLQEQQPPYAELEGTNAVYELPG